MKKALLFFVLAGAIASVSIGGIGGCGGTSAGNRAVDSGGSGSGGGGSTAAGSKSWSQTGTAALTVDDIVNGSGSGALTLSSGDKNVSTSTSAAFYFGRFIYDDGTDYFCGSIKFKIKKENDTSAYFSDVTLKNLSVVNELNLTSTALPDYTDMDLGVNPSFDSSTNHVGIENATTRFVAFELYFGGSAPFPAITDAGAIFSSDFTTMAGGDDANFFLIAQKVDSQPDVTSSDIVDNWSARRFTVDTSNGAITTEGDFNVSVDSADSFTGTDSVNGNFGGSLNLTDASAGCFAYVLDGGTGVDGGFLLSADKSLAVGRDLTTLSYFAMQK